MKNWYRLRIAASVLLMLFVIGCDSMYEEERRNIERQIRRRLSSQTFPGYRVDKDSIHAYGFGRAGAPRKIKHDYCYVDVRLIGDSGRTEKHRFKVIYLSKGNLIQNIFLDD